MNEFANVENFLRTTKAFPSTRKDLYHVLGLSRGAKAADIRRAYHRLARKLHPDIRPGDEAAERAFKVVNAAHEILSDATKREAYDAWAASRDMVRAAGRRRFFQQQAIVFTTAFAVSSGAFVGTLVWLRHAESPGAPDVARSGAAVETARLAAAASSADQPPEPARAAEPDKAVAAAILPASSAPSGASVADVKADHYDATERGRHDVLAAVETSGAMTAATASSDRLTPPLVLASNRSELFDKKMDAGLEPEIPGMRLPGRMGEDRENGTIEAPFTLIETAGIPTSKTSDTAGVSAKRSNKPEKGIIAQDRAAKARKPAGERGPKLEGSGGRTIVAEERAVSAPRPQVAAYRAEPRFQTADEPFVDPVGINK